LLVTIDNGKYPEPFCVFPRGVGLHKPKGRNRKKRGEKTQKISGKNLDTLRKVGRFGFGRRLRGCVIINWGLHFTIFLTAAYVLAHGLVWTDFC